MRASLIPMNRLFVVFLGLSMTAIWPSASWPSHRVQPPVVIKESVRSIDQPESTHISRRETEPDKTATARVNEAYGKLPIGFELNQGQYDSRVRLAAHGRGYSLFLTANEAVMTLSNRSLNKLSANPRANVHGLSDLQPPAGQSAAELQLDKQAGSGSSDRTLGEAKRQRVVRMKLLGANRSPGIEQIDELPGKSNYFIGNDPKKWHTAVANYAKVHYRSVYKGIDLVYHGEQGKLEYDFNVAPGANPKAIRLAFEGLNSVRIDASGDLLLSTRTGEITQRKPIAYQDVDGARKEIAVRYATRGKNQIGFVVGRHDASRPLVIDPVLSYSTYLGGSGSGEIGGGIAVDASGYAYVVGFTSSADFPTENPLQSNPGDGAEAFVTKLNPTGTALVYSTFLGGSDYDQAFAIAVDSAGNGYVAGETLSADFPIVNAIQPTHGTGRTTDAFVAKINASGSALVYSTFLGGSKQDVGQAIAVDSAGDAYVTGYTRSPDFPTANALQPALLGSSDTFVTKFNPSGSLAYSTFLGGNGGDVGYGIAVDSFGQAYLAGSTSSPDFPLWNPLQSDFKGRTAFKSTSGGGQWAAINSGIPDFRSINALAVDTLVPSTLYAGSSSGGVFKSTDSGTTWTSANTGLTNLNISAVAVDPRNSDIVYASGLEAFKSTDGGGSWNIIRFDNAPSLSIDPSNSSIVYTGWISGISKTTDGGATWRNILVQAPVGGYVATLPKAIAIDPITPTTLYVAGPGNLIFKSVDGGTTWQLLWNGLFFQGYDSLAIDPSTPSTIYAGSTRAGVFKSTDGGQNWTRSFFIPGIGSINSLAIDPVSPSTVYAGTFGANVFKTTDGGTTWMAARDGLTNSFVYALAINPGNPSTLYAGTEGAAEGFVLELNAAGSALLYSTFLGGDETDYCTGIAVDGFGNAYVSGGTYSTNFPTASPLQPSKAGYLDGFVAKLNPLGSALVYSTYLGGSFDDVALGLALDLGGNAYVTGSTVSTDFPVASPLAGSAGDPQGNAFVAKVNNAGTVLAYSTYLGSPDIDSSTSDDQANAIAVDSMGNAYVTGETFSNQFPTTPGAFQPNLRGPENAFISKLSSSDESGCTFTLSRDHQSFPGSAGNGSVNVTASDPGCPWTASTSATFIHITSGTPGTGNGTLMYTVDATPGSTNRSDTITIAGHTYTVYQGIDFLDVPANNLFYTEIGILAARGVTLGCTQDHTMYCPNDSVLREQMSAFILRAKGELSPPDPPSQRFTDVLPANPFYNFIDRLAVLGITVGCNPPANTMYCPSSAVTREQMAAFILRGLGEFSPPDPPSQRFNDVPPGNVFYNFIDRLAALNITLGCTPDHLFYCPSDPVTRGQMAAFLVRAFDL